MGKHSELVKLITSTVEGNVGEWSQVRNRRDKHDTYSYKGSLDTESGHDVTRLVWFGMHVSKFPRYGVIVVSNGGEVRLSLRSSWLVRKAIKTWQIRMAEISVCKLMISDQPKQKEASKFNPAGGGVGQLTQAAMQHAANNMHITQQQMYANTIAANPYSQLGKP